MKKNILLLLCLFITFAVVAQKQQGLVRTIERPGQKSVGIKGATVKINEYPNALVSGKGGKFSFSIPGKKQGDRCLVTSVTKKGYTMTDKLPSFAYSANTPVEIVMVSNKQLQHDEKRIRDKALQEAEARYHKRIAELERQLNEKTISEEQYREQLQQVFDGHENFLKMINEMARRYAMTDYKGISEINRQIQECIENAELERADSLINSKGDINLRNQELQNKKETTQKLAELHKQAQEDYETYLNDLAQDYYNKHLICASKYQNDSAAYWLEQRAALDDTTNVEWLSDAGNFVRYYLADYDLAMDHYQKGLKCACHLYSENNRWVAIFNNCIGMIHSRKGEFNKALKHYQTAIDIMENQPETDNSYIALIYNNIGTCYEDNGDYAHSLEFYQKALSFDGSTDTKSLHVATYYNNIGSVYSHLADYNHALEYTQKALDIFERVLGMNDPNVATTVNNIGTIYCSTGEYAKAVECYQKAININERVLGTNHPSTAQCYRNIGVILDKQEDYAHALDYYEKSLLIYEHIHGPNHPDVAECYNSIGNVYNDQGDFAKALEYCMKALEIRELTIDPNHLDVAASYNSIGSILDDQGYLDQALECYEKALHIREQKLTAKHPDIALMYNNIGGIYIKTRDYNKALEYYLKALDMVEQSSEIDPSLVGTINSNIGVAYSELGDDIQGLIYFQKGLVFYERAFGMEHSYVARSYLNIGATYFKQGDYSQAMEYYKKLLAMPKQYLGSYLQSVIIRHDICLYQLAVESSSVKDFFSNHCFTETVNDGDNPARKQGMSGEYILLEFANWTEASSTSLFDKNKELSGKPKDIVVLKDGVITKHHFDNMIGARLGIKQITKEERKQINQLYEKWKKEQNN